MNDCAITSLFLLAMAGCAAPQPATPRDVSEQLAARLQQRLNELVDAHDVPALAVAVVVDDQVVAAVAGNRVAQKDTPVEIRMRWHLGSCGKSMTASLIALLVERGTLRWDQTIAESFPSLVDRIRPEYHDVTLTQLLAHRGGLPERSWPDNMLRLAIDALPGQGRAQRREYLEIILNEEPSAEPGTAFHYSNAGYIVAGAMAEAATDRDWVDLMLEHVFAPLQIASVGFGAPGIDHPEREPWGHLQRGETLIPFAPGPMADNPAVLGPAGTMHMSIADFARYARWHLRAMRGDTRRLAPETFARLWNDFDGDGYALGWGLAQLADNELVYTHAGSNTLWFATIKLFPSRNLAIVSASNGGFARGQKAVIAAEKAALESVADYRAQASASEQND